MPPHAVPPYNARIEVFAYSPLEPLLYQPPTNQTVTVGTSITLAVGVFGAQPMLFQWSFNGTDLPGATNALLVLSNALPLASGIYSFKASNALGTAASDGVAGGFRCHLDLQQPSL